MWSETKDELILYTADTFFICTALFAGGEPLLMSACSFPAQGSQNLFYEKGRPILPRII